MPSDSIPFDHAADYYDATRGFPPGVDQQVAALIARAAGLDGSSRVLEVGVGTGRIALPLARHVRQVVGIDLARPMLDRLRAKRTDEPVWLVRGDAVHLPFRARVFDAALSVHVFHLIPAWREALAELARALRIGGVLIYGNNRWGGHPGIDALNEAWRQAVPPEIDRGVGMPRGEEAAAFESAGWEQIGEEQMIPFSVWLSPAEFIARLEQRRYSSTWRVTEEQLARGLAAVRAEIPRHFADLATQVELKTGFALRVYRPPARP